MAKRDQQKLDQALDIFQEQVPDRLCRAIRWLRNPRARMVRLPLGVLCVLASFFWFLPVVGLEFLPLGLLLIAIDVPVLQRPVATATLWLEHQWLRRKSRWSPRARRWWLAAGARLAPWKARKDTTMIQDHRNHKAGVYASPRQPQGDFGRGKDHAPLGSRDDVNQALNQRGAYRDAETAPDEPDKKSHDGPQASKGKVANDHNKTGNKAPTQLNQGQRTPKSRNDREAHGPGPNNPGVARKGGHGGGT